MNAAVGSFQDLKVRILSAIVMAVIGIGAIWVGGPVFLGLMVVASGLMIGELMRMLHPELQPTLLAMLGVVAGASVLWVAFEVSYFSFSGLLLAPLIGAAMVPKGKRLFFGYSVAIILAVLALIVVRLQSGLPATLWVILVVIASDVGGYFFGRILGGPKILPRISPKKTWSGTLGGWALAGAVAGVFVWLGYGDVRVIWLSVLLSVAAQAGDMVESAIKRHAGVKDASNLIPGHGGFLDRFDALIGAALLLIPIWFLLGLPVGKM
ncbi:MAG: phosphatidate cytidylyltransferase [Rhodobacterales bacterium]|jgi:phosphatidate cytidylyltransferase|nr:phosphatidate cytidylyltransferase [Pseudomonadota bacterium]NQW15141.1 phosphatidate cytidylyltransferase [Rhodobacter sp.]